MANFLNPQMVASEILAQIEYELVIGNLMYRDRTAEFGTARGLKVGDFVNFRTVTDFRTDQFNGVGPITTQEITQSQTQLQIERHFDTSVIITARERALNLDGIRQEIVNPVAVSIAQEIDEYLGTKIGESQGLYSSNTLLQDASDIAQARRQAILQQIAKGDMTALIDEDLEATLLGTDVFHRFDTRGTDNTDTIRNGMLGRLMGIDWFSTVNFNEIARTAGNGTTTLDNTAPTDNEQGQTQLTVAATAGTFEAGDKIQIAGAKRDFTVAAQVLAGGTAIPLVEQINENLRKLGTAAVSVRSATNTTTNRGIIFNPMAYGFAMPPLDPAAGALNSATATSNGFSLRVTEQYDIQSKETVWSFDILLGAKLIDTRKSMLIASF